MERKTKMTGVDLSHWNRDVDFKKLAEQASFVILKIGGEEKEAGKLHVDNTFYRRYYQAKEAGLHVGGYFFMSTSPVVFSTTPDHICGQLENAITNMEFDMPIYIDVEGQPVGYKTKLTEYVKRWCAYMESLNYYVGIYGSDLSTFKDLLNIDNLAAYDKWVARYGKEPEYVKKYGMWQCSSKAEVNGVSGKCDLDYAYYDYPVIIKKMGMNR